MVAIENISTVLHEAVAQVRAAWPDRMKSYRLGIADRTLVLVEDEQAGIKLCDVGFTLAANGVATPQ